MVRIISTFVVLVVLGLGSVKAQYFPNTTIYMFDKYKHNLAYAGFDGTLRLNGTIRRQWTGVTGNPQENYVNVHLPLFEYKSAVGLRVHNDKIGAHDDLKITGTWNYVYDKSSLGLFSFGGGIGIQSRKLDGALLTTPDGEYGNGGSHQDPVLSNRMVTFNRPIFSAAIFFRNNLLDIGVQMEQLYSGKFKNKEGLPVLFKNNSTLTAFAQYKYEIYEDLKLLPSVMYKTDGNQNQLDFNVVGELRQRFYLGLGYRGFNSLSSDALLFIFGIKSNNRLDVYYGYDYTLSSLNDHVSGTHELVVSYLLGKPVGIKLPQPVIYNTRFF